MSGGVNVIGMDINSFRIAICIATSEPPTLELIEFAESKEDDTMQKRLSHLKAAVDGWLKRRRHFGQQTIVIEEPTMNAGSGGAAKGSGIAIGFTYAVWALLMGAGHQVTVVHPSTWKANYRKRFDTGSAVRNKEDVVRAVRAAQPEVAAEIEAMSGNARIRQDLYDAVGVAYGKA